MNQRKKILWTGMLSFLLVGVVLVSIPFIGSFNPPANAGEGLPHIDISELHENEYMIYDLDDKWWRYLTSFMIVRFQRNNYSIYYMSRNMDGATMLPDLRWRRPGWPCHDFRPSTINGKVTGESIIQCFDNDDEYRPGITWKETGESIDHSYDSMERIEKYSVEGKYLIIGKG